MPKRELTGKVVSDSANKTISVLVERTVLHPIYKKTIKKNKKYSVHDENNSHKVGDTVTIIESRPISKTKKWTVVSSNKV